MVGAVPGGPGRSLREVENSKNTSASKSKPKKKKIEPQVSEKKPVYDDILGGYYGKSAEVAKRP